MYRIRKAFAFECAHQLKKAFSSACVDSIHGHSYKVEIFLVADSLQDGMVLDFGQLKGFKERVQEEWDHALLLPEGFTPPESCHKVMILKDGQGQPTAEWMAKVLFEALREFLRAITPSLRVRAEKVRVHETESGWAEFVGDEK